MVASYAATEILPPGLEASRWVMVARAAARRAAEVTFVGVASGGMLRVRVLGAAVEPGELEESAATGLEP